MPAPHADTGLLVMDVQPGIIDRVADAPSFLKRMTAAIDAARAHVPRHPRGRWLPARRAGSERAVQVAAGQADRSAPATHAGAERSGGGEATGERVRRTSGVVLSTLREASDKDFQLTVLSDLCADADDEVHRVLTTKVFPRQATVVTAEEWMAAR